MSLFEASNLEAVRTDALNCTRCDLYKNATQTVFGEGPPAARVMFVGEQPGDKEDLAGHPFVGPAGKLFNEALEEASIKRDDTYVTNVVKHFKWKPAGKVRLHQKPNAGEIRACKPWLEQEINLVGPEMVVMLGATAAQALMGSSFRVTKQHGEVVTLPEGVSAVATVHPSSILRAPDEAARQLAYEGFVEDLKVVTKTMKTAG
jgi:uracil-DNA glycosylase